MSAFEEELARYLEKRGDLPTLEAALVRSLQADPSSRSGVLRLLDQLFHTSRLPARTYIALKAHLSELPEPPQSPAPPQSPVPPPDTGPASGILDILNAPSPGPPGGGSAAPAGSEPPPAEDRTTFRGGAPPAADSTPSEDRTMFRQSAPTRSSAVQSSMPHSGSGVSWGTGRSSRTGTGAGTGSNWTDPSKWGAGPAPTMQPGSILKDRYVLETVIGRGGMGVVFKARDLRREEAQDRNPHIAVKILNDEFRQHPESLKALQRESRKAQDLAHPNIVTVFDFDRDGAIVYMTMEYLEGQSLDRITKGASFDGMSIPQAYPLIEGVGRALGYAHRKGVVHSDFKPANAFLTKEDVVKVFDFGIARAAKLQDDKPGEETRFDPGTLGALTPAYASCEMLEGEEPDARDDIYALACVTYELLTGRHPFDKRSANDARARNLVPAPVKGLTRRQWRGLQRGLAFSRADRSPNVDTFLDEIRARKLSRTSIAIGLAAGVAVLAVGTLTVPSYLRDLRIDGKIQEITDGSAAAVTEALNELAAFDPAEREAVLADDAVENRLIDYYIERIEMAEAALDYPAAEALVAESQALYDDSNRLSIAAEEVERTKNELLVELDDRFNANLQSGALLPADGEDIADVLAAYARIDPDNPALTDPRLAIAYANVAERALAKNPLLAKQYLDEGQRRFPEDRPLVGLRDRLNTLLEVRDHERRVAELAERLSGLLPSLDTLEDARPLERDLQELAALDPDHRLLSSYRSRLQRLLEARIDAAVRANDWAAARDAINTSGPLAAPEFRSAALARIGAAEAAYGEQVGGIFTALTEAARNGDLEAARAGVAELERQGADAATLVEARAAVAHGYLDRARSQRAAGAFDDARATVAEGQRFEPAFAEWGGEVAAIAEAERRQREGEQEAQRQQRLARIGELQNGISRNLARSGFDIETATETLARVDDLAALDPGNPLAVDGRSQVAARLAAAARALAADGDRLDEALEMIARSERLIPGTQVLRAAREELGKQREVAFAQRAQERISDQRSELERLIGAPEYDGDWDRNVRRLIQELASSPGQGEFLAARRNEVAGLCVTRAETLLAENRLNRAEELLGWADWYVRDFEPVRALRARLESQRVEFEQESRQRERVAAIDGLKRSFAAELAAQGITEAKRTLERLRQLLPEDDPFLAREAPRTIADTYEKMAQAALDQQRFDRAFELARAGLAEFPGHARLRTLTEGIVEARLAHNVNEVTAVLREAPPSDAAGPRQTLEAVRADAGDGYREIEVDLLAVAGARVRAAAGTERGALVGWYGRIFGAFEAIVPEGKPCTPNLAGYGSRVQGRCFDFLPDASTQGPRLVVIPAGRGIAEPFAISREEVSVADWNAYCRISDACGPRLAGNEQVPITNVAISEVLAYAEWLTRTTDHAYRLPTMTEWEYAASAESRGNPSPNCLNPQAGTGDSLVAVGWGGENDYGLKNYVGNAQEWVVAPSGNYVARGGAFPDRLGTCAIELTRPHDGSADELTGFRLVRELDEDA